MPKLTDLPIPLVPAGEHLSTPFTVLLLVHVLAGLIGVAAGVVAALSRKRRGRHPRFGTVYFASVSVVFLTATGMGVLRWDQDSYLVALGTLSFGAASVGYAARKIRWRRWIGYHIVGMGLSYIVLLTAFYVDNGPRLPVWDRLPAFTYGVLPSLVGVPLVIRALCRHTHLNNHLRAAGRAVLRRTRSSS
jgi:hypothetical protein